MSEIFAALKKAKASPLTQRCVQSKVQNHKVPVNSPSTKSVASRIETKSLVCTEPVVKKSRLGEDVCEIVRSKLFAWKTEYEKTQVRADTVRTLLREKDDQLAEVHRHIEQQLGNNGVLDARQDGMRKRNESTRKSLDELKAAVDEALYSDASNLKYFSICELDVSKVDEKVYVEEKVMHELHCALVKALDVVSKCSEFEPILVQLDKDIEHFQNTCRTLEYSIVNLKDKTCRFAKMNDELEMNRDYIRDSISLQEQSKFQAERCLLANRKALNEQKLKSLEDGGNLKKELQNINEVLSSIIAEVDVLCKNFRSAELQQEKIKNMSAQASDLYQARLNAINENKTDFQCHEKLMRELETEHETIVETIEHLNLQRETARAVQNQLLADTLENMTALSNLLDKNSALELELHPFRVLFEKLNDRQNTALIENEEMLSQIHDTSLIFDTAEKHLISGQKTVTFKKCDFESLSAEEVLQINATSKAFDDLFQCDVAQKLEINDALEMLKITQNLEKQASVEFSQAKLKLDKLHKTLLQHSSFEITSKEPTKAELISHEEEVLKPLRDSFESKLSLKYMQLAEIDTHAPAKLAQWREREEERLTARRPELQSLRAELNKLSSELALVRREHAAIAAEVCKRAEAKAKKAELEAKVAACAEQEENVIESMPQKLKPKEKKNAEPSEITGVNPEDSYAFEASCHAFKLSQKQSESSESFLAPVRIPSYKDVTSVMAPVEECNAPLKRNARRNFRKDFELEDSDYENLAKHERKSKKERVSAFVCNKTKKKCKSSLQDDGLSHRKSLSQRPIKRHSSPLCQSKKVSKCILVSKSEKQSAKNARRVSSFEAPKNTRIGSWSHTVTPVSSMALSQRGKKGSGRPKHGWVQDFDIIFDA